METSLHRELKTRFGSSGRLEVWHDGRRADAHAPSRAPRTASKPPDAPGPYSGPSEPSGPARAVSGAC